MTKADKAIKFLQSLKIPEGPAAGKQIKLAPFQKQYVKNTFKRGVVVSCLSVGRGNGKSAIAAGIALGELVGIWDDQPRREIICAARTQQQALVIYDYVLGLAKSLPEDLQAEVSGVRAPYPAIRYGEHLIRCVAANPKNVLGTSPTLAICDERGHWDQNKGDDLEAALLSGLGKRGGRCLMISTSASSDTASFSQWLDDPPPGCYVQQHLASLDLAPDDPEAIKQANPGAEHGIGASVDWLQAQAKRAIARGGSALSSFRLYNLNQRVSDDHSNVLITLDDWQECEVSELPPREGAAIVGIDLGGSTSMSAVAAYWPNTRRLEAFAAFPNSPGLADRGARDGVRDRYVEMADRGELVTLGGRVVPAAEFLQRIMQLLDGAPVACFTADRYRQAEFMEAMQQAGIRVPVVWRGMGWKDGAEDVERFRKAVYDGLVNVSPSLLLRSAFADAVTVQDIAGNSKLAKARSTGRIDAAAAAILAVAEGQRRAAVPIHRRAPVWA